MANKKVKHIIAKLVGGSTAETLDVYDASALHSEDVINSYLANDDPLRTQHKALDAARGTDLNNRVTSCRDDINAIRAELDNGTFSVQHELKTGVTRSYDSSNQLHWDGDPLGPGYVSGTYRITLHTATATGYYSMYLVSFNASDTHNSFLRIAEFGHTEIYPKLGNTAVQTDGSGTFTGGGNIYVYWGEDNRPASVWICKERLY